MSDAVRCQPSKEIRSIKQDQKGALEFKQTAIDQLAWICIVHMSLLQLSARIRDTDHEENVVLHINGYTNYTCLLNFRPCFYSS
eukprot:scaffold259653_cov83-Cyclotella_meneghiniana.AAC.3